MAQHLLVNKVYMYTIVVYKVTLVHDKYIIYCVLEILLVCTIVYMYTNIVYKLL